MYYKNNWFELLATVHGPRLFVSSSTTLENVHALMAVLSHDKDDKDSL